MSEFKSDELFLRGRVQVETALGALAHSGINLDVQVRLQKLLDVHNQMSVDENQQDLSIYLQGEVVEREKADIMSSLDSLHADQKTPNGLRLAAQALREII